METQVGVTEAVFSEDLDPYSVDFIEVNVDSDKGVEATKETLDQLKNDLPEDIGLYVRRNIPVEYWQGEGTAGDIRDAFMKDLRVSTKAGVEAFVVDVPRPKFDEVDDRLFNYLVKAARNHSSDRVQCWFVTDFEDEEFSDDILGRVAKTLIQKFGIGAKLDDQFLSWYDLKSDLFLNRVSFKERFRHIRIDDETSMEDSNVIDLVSDVVNLEHRVRSVLFEDIESWKNHHDLELVKSDVEPVSEEE